MGVRGEREEVGVRGECEEVGVRGEEKMVEEVGGRGEGGGGGRLRRWEKMR